MSSRIMLKPRVSFVWFALFLCSNIFALMLLFAQQVVFELPDTQHLIL